MNELFALLLILLSSCNVEKYLQPGQYLLNSNKLEVSKPHRKETRKQLSQFFKQKPNSKLFLIFKTKPYFYFKGSEGGDNRFKKFERNVFGEPPVIIDSLFIESTVQSMKMYMQSTGYFYSEINYEVIPRKNGKADVVYHVKQNQQYKIGTYNLQIDDKRIYDIVKHSMNESRVKIGTGLHYSTFETEESRVVSLLRNNGYFLMSKDFVDYNVDTAGKNFYTSVGLNVRNLDDGSAHHKFYNNEMVVEIEQNSEANSYRGKDTFTAKNFTYIPNRFELNPAILDRNILLVKGREFKEYSLSRTYTRISDLGIFRFVNITPSVMYRNDSAFVNYHMKVIPMVKYDYSIEPQATASDQTNAISYQSSRNFGFAMELKLRDRNIFHGAEILQFSFRSAFEAQGGAHSKTFFNTTEQRLTASLIMPRTLWMPSFDRNDKFLNTKTAFNLSGIYEVNFDYKRQIYSTNMTYQFNKQLISYVFVPIEFSFIKSEMSDALQERSASDIFIQNLFSNNVILDHRFGFNYTNKPIAKGLHYYTLKWDVIEVAGSLMSAIKRLTGASKNPSGEYTMFGVRYYEYIKSAIDFRLNTLIDKNNATAYRIFAGAALPYGNTPNFAPFEKRFFVGGANDLRGWLPRSIGPGSFYTPGQLDYSGEIKLEANAEFRFNIYNKWLEGAVFGDAGNIWSIKPNTEKPGADFSLDRFYKEIAIDGGFGARLNFEVFIIRFDFAIPLRDPSSAHIEKWVVKDINGEWLSRNFIFNFGIGYPF